MENADTIIIGAGAAGLAAAYELSKAGQKVIVLEARNRTGGRIYSYNDPEFLLPVEQGAEFIHGKAKITLGLLKKFGIKYYEEKGELWRSHKGELQEQGDFVEDMRLLKKKLNEVKDDMSIRDFLNMYFSEPQYESQRNSIKNYVEGYDAADIGKASTLAFRQELESSSEKQYRIEGGYETLISKLENECIKNNYSVFLSIVVKEINWGGTVVEVVSDIEERFTASKVLITVPLGILQSEQQPASISFYPPLPEKINAARSIGYGSVIKLMYQFRQPFWENEEVKKSTGKDLRKMSFVFSDQEIPTWWTQLPENACQLTGWVAGPNAVKLKSLDEKAILKKGLESLSAIFKMSADELKEKIVDSRAVNWITDPFSLGAYSYPTVNAERFIHTLREPVNNTLFFAGEALGIKSLCGTVEAALESGIQAANEILNNEEDPVTGIPEEAEVSFWSLWKTQMQLG